MSACRGGDGGGALAGAVLGSNTGADASGSGAGVLMSVVKSTGCFTRVTKSSYIQSPKQYNR